MAIVSNKNDAAVKELNEIYFSGCVSAAIGEVEGRQRKPAPDEVYAALEELGSTKDEAVYIGDSEVDYATACASGLPCVLVSWGFRDKELLESFDAEKVVDNVKDLREFLFDFYTKMIMNFTFASYDEIRVKRKIYRCGMEEFIMSEKQRKPWIS